MKLARGSMPWLVVPGIVAVGAAVAAWMFSSPWSAIAVGLAALAGLVFLFFLQFFRDPERAVADGIVSPADGKVVRMDEVEDPDVGAADRLAIFMSPKDVHVNRFPLAGTVVEVRHIPGSHLPAFRKESDRNERVATVLDTELGRVKVVQIAGTVARRIVPYATAGLEAAKGDRMGLIRLGSRCDLYIPRGRVSWTVEMGQQVHGAMTQVAAPKASSPSAKRSAASKAPAKTGSPKPAKAAPKPRSRGGKA